MWKTRVHRGWRHGYRRQNEPVSSDDPVEPQPTFSDEERALFKEAAYVDEILLLTLESFPVQLHAVLKGNLPDGCTRIAEIAVEKHADDIFEIHVYTLRPEAWPAPRHWCRLRSPLRWTYTACLQVSTPSGHMISKRPSPLRAQTAWSSDRREETGLDIV